MLPFSTPGRRESIYLSVDGGTYTVGLCLFKINDLTNEMEILDTHLINIRKPDHNYDYLEERHGFETVRMLRLEDELDRYLTEKISEYQCIDLLIYESHFFNVRRPTAAIPLVRFMQVTERACVNHGIVMVTVSPQQMKRTIGISRELAKADKFAVKTKIQALIDRRMIHFTGSLDDISEHEIDAMGIGYTQMIIDKLLVDNPS